MAKNRIDAVTQTRWDEPTRRQKMRHRREESKRGWGEDEYRTGRGVGGRRRAAAAASVGERVREDAGTWSAKRSAVRSGLWPVGTRVAVRATAGEGDSAARFGVVVPL